MKLEYNIIWFENDPTAINGFEINKIQDFLSDRGFELKVTFILGNEPRSTVDIPYEYKVHTNYSRKDFGDIPLRNADLILMDKDLEGEMNGDEIIKHIRDHENDIYCDVLFYSTGKSEEELRDIVRRDGLYCSNRGNVEQKAINVIIVSIKKTQDLNNLRGLVMAETSQLDKLMGEIIEKLYYKNLITDDKSQEVIQHSVEHYSGLLEKLERIGLDFGEFIMNGFTKSVNVKCTALGKFSKIVGVPIKHSAIKHYNVDINQPRNDLAHEPEIVTEDKITVNGQVYDENRFIELRKKIQIYKKGLSEINDALS